MDVFGRAGVKLGRWRPSILVKILFAFAVVLFVATLKLVDWEKPRGKPIEGKPPALKEGLLKVMHLDLKGGPPKLSFLVSVLPLARDAGANALLLEYEDMFPFSGRLRNVSARNAYALDEIRKLVEFAEGMKMEVIPLVQSLGHLEYALKLEEFRHLREAEDFPQEICPLKREAVDLVKELIRQVMEVHRNSRYIHIGCDEVRHLGFCPRCSRTDPKKLFSSHVAKIAAYVRSHYQGVTPLIWDDMLRRWTFREVAASGLGSLVEPVVWIYVPNIFLLVPPVVWNGYLANFPRLWVASAFKGAFGEKETLPNLTLHLENTLAWTRVLTGSAEEISVLPEAFAGIFVTGWSRYDHFAVLCELLPVSVPSLVLSLLFLDPRYRKSETFSRWLHVLGCREPLLGANATVLESQALFQSALGNCSFPGSSAYREMSRYVELRKQIRRVTGNLDSSGWFSRYNLDRNFTSPWRLVNILPDGGEALRKELARWKASFLPLMKEYFDEATASEWSEQNVEPLEESLDRIRKKFRDLMGRKAWPRRPLDRNPR